MLPTPTWISDDFGEAETTFRLRLAALYTSEKADTYRHTALKDADAAGRIIDPAWLKRVPAKDRGRARLRFLIRVAALYASSEGTVSALSSRIGLIPRALSNYIAPTSGREKISAVNARKIHEACGGVVTREMLNPEAFAD